MIGAAWVKASHTRGADIDRNAAGARADVDQRGGNASGFDQRLDVEQLRALGVGGADDVDALHGVERTSAHGPLRALHRLRHAAAPWMFGKTGCRKGGAVGMTIVFF